jgi:hypothetical protein
MGALLRLKDVGSFVDGGVIGLNVGDSLGLEDVGD